MLIPLLQPGEGDPKPIFPDDTLARRENDGSWKCGTCVNEDIDSASVKANPNSEKAQKIIARRQREEMFKQTDKRLREGRTTTTTTTATSTNQKLFK